MTSIPLATVPSPLTERLQQCQLQVDSFIQDYQLQLSKAIQQEMLHVLLASPFISTFLQRKPQWFVEAFAKNSFQQSMTYDLYLQALQQVIKNTTSIDLLSQQLRDFRNQQMIRIAWRDLAGLSNISQSMQELSFVADVCIKEGLNWLKQALKAVFGMPISLDENDQPQEMELMVIAMGKLGAYELNFSSDIDLIFVFPEHGETINGKRQLSHNEYFIKLGLQLIQLLDSKTAFGFVFRVDMRLRPFGKSGPMAVSMSSIEDYYATHGREWERYALIKARVVTGRKGDIEYLKQILNPFIYRRYIDFGVFESLRDMKKMIALEVKLKQLEHNIKLGAGGIREIEFLAQAFQLLRGGRETELQQTSVLIILALLSKKNLIPEYVKDDLVKAYLFLRNTEHCLQEYNDQQTHLLPINSLEQAVLAYAMGYDDWTAFISQLNCHRKKVHENFNQLFQAPQIEKTKELLEHSELKTASQVTNILEHFWLKLEGADKVFTKDEAIEQLALTGFSNSKAIVEALMNFQQSSAYRQISSSGRTRLNALMPLILKYLVDKDDIELHGIEKHEMLIRLLNIIESVCRRSVYLALLIENPLALSQLFKLSSASVWISREIQRVPALLDELLDPRVLYSPLDKAALCIDLQQRISALSEDDLEQQMEVLRHFKQSHVLRVAAADVSGSIKITKVSDYLTWIAEVVLAYVLHIAWKDTVKKYGKPSSDGLTGEVTESKMGFAIIGFGKIGGRELAYGSDLDLVFVYADEYVSGQTSGEKSVANSLFYIRMGQRIMHILGTRTYSGVLYECDLRLRPNGNSGQIAVSMQSLANYQLNHAWLWEHQALCRARFVAGDKGLDSCFEQMRSRVLERQRDSLLLQKEVFEMRLKMRQSLVKRQAGFFDVKQAAGGIVDIEFMVQFLILKHSHNISGLLAYRDNISLLQIFVDKKILTKTISTTLANAYQDYRHFVHQQTLQEESGLASETLFEAQRQQVQDCWQQIMERS